MNNIEKMDTKVNDRERSTVNSMWKSVWES